MTTSNAPESAETRPPLEAAADAVDVENQPSEQQQRTGYIYGRMGSCIFDPSLSVHLLRRPR